MYKRQLSYEVEIHAAETYAKYLAYNGHDDKILEILNDELEHSRELHKAIEMIKWVFCLCLHLFPC